MQQEHTISDLLNQLAGREAEVPNGWFRWMHHGYFGRCGAPQGREEPDAVSTGELWRLIGDALKEDDLEDSVRLAPWMGLAERHAWPLGKHAMSSLISRLLRELPPLARGRVLAGASERINRWVMDQETLASTADWLTRLWNDGSEVVLDGVSAAGIACNAIAISRNDLLARVLDSVVQWGEQTVERLEPFGDSSRERWDTDIDALSERAIDRCLEAAIRIGNVEAVRMCLAAGAAPDIRVWMLERSYNERYCALSFATFRSGEDGFGLAMAHTLLDGGADPSGTNYDGRNKPLFGALSCGQWDLAEQLLDRGASFTGGNNDGFRPDPGARFQFPSNPNYGHRNEDLVWAEREIGSLIPLADICEVPGFYRGDGQGGSYGRFLPACCEGDDVETLKRFEALGLPLVLTAQDVVKFCRSWAVPFLCLEYILERLEAPPEVMFRMRRRCPDIAIGGYQFLCRPEQNGSNVIKEFNANGQTPLEMPDGSRYYAFLDAIAFPGHDLGFVPEHHVFVLGVAANYRRRTDHVITRGLRFQWKLQPVQCSIYRHFQRRTAPWDLLPVVKEVDGTFLWTGVNLGKLWWLDWPEEWKDLVRDWVDGPSGEEIIAMAEARVAAQDAANVRTPPVVLSEEDLDGYPPEFWPCLRRLDDGRIGVTEESCRFDPPIRERYRRWAAENKPDLETFVPDPCLMAWPLWDSIPWELQPFFVYDDLFRKPTVITEGRNEYERAMVRKAVRWNNAQFMEAFRQLDEGKGG